MSYVLHSKPNDCTVCAVLNTLQQIGISISQREAEEATMYNEHGGHADIGLKIIADKLGILGEYYPKYEDIIWIPHETKKNIEIAKPEFNKGKLFIGFKNKLKDGWVAVTSHRWENTEDFHAISLTGVENENIKVICSLKGEYLAGQDMLVSEKNQLNGLTSTFWIKK